MKKTWTIAALAASMLFGGAALADDTPASPSARFAHAKRCQVNGWKSLTDAAGTPFADQEACVVYTVRGGELFRAVPAAPAFDVVSRPRVSAAPVGTVAAAAPRTR